LSSELDTSDAVAALGVLGGALLTAGVVIVAGAGWGCIAAGAMLLLWSIWRLR
jgi:hypothetical protein